MSSKGGENQLDAIFERISNLRKNLQESMLNSNETAGSNVRIEAEIQPREPLIVS